MSGRIYFIGTWGFKELKIGHTGGPLAPRLSALQIGNPCELRPYVVMGGSRADEKALHALFRPYLIRGEWFSHEGVLREYIAEEREAGRLLYHRLDGGAEPR